MRLIVYYVVFMIAGDLAAYFIGLITEEAWVAWVLAVWMTEPKHTAPVST